MTTYTPIPKLTEAVSYTEGLEDGATVAEEMPLIDLTGLYSWVHDEKTYYPYFIVSGNKAYVPAIAVIVTNAITLERYPCNAQMFFSFYQEVTGGGGNS
jgi:hypothetical protein